MMAFTVFTAVASMVVLIGCDTSSTRTTNSVKTVNTQSRPRTHLTATATNHEHDTEDTTSSSLLPDPYTLGNTANDSSSVSITGKKETHDKMAERATNFLHSVLGMSHVIRERKEGKLLNGTATDLESTSQGFVTMGLDSATSKGMQDSVNSLTPKVLTNMATVMTEKGSGGPPLNALYVLHSLVNYVASTGDKYKPKRESKESSDEHANALYALYSLILYVENADDLNELTSISDHGKHNQATKVAGWFSALHYKWEQASASNGESSKFSPWTGYSIIAISVVAAVILVVVAATCMTRYCHRPNTHASVASNPVVRGIVSPSI